MSRHNTAKLGLANFYNLGEAGWNAGYDENWRKVDALLQASVLDKDLATPPGSPADGACYIIAASPTGAWAGHAKSIARWSADVTAWEFYAPAEGWRFRVNDEDLDYEYDGSAWVSVPSIGVTLKTNGTNNGSQTTLNLKSGSNVTLSDDGVGGITISSTASGSSLVDPKDSVRAATTAALPSNSYSSGVLTASANGALAAQDGVTLSVSDRILVKNESSGLKNGIYTVTDLGSGSTPWILTRATDADTSAKVTAGMFMFITEGTTLADTLWELTTNDPITLGTTALTFNRVIGVGIANAGCVGSHSNLVITTTGTNASVTLTADEVLLENADNVYWTARNVSVVINTATTGAAGIDTGSVAASTWYYVWVIAKPDGTISAVASTSFTSPTLPSGYTFKALVGEFRTDGTGNKYPLSYRKTDKCAQYVVWSGTNVTGLPLMASGTAGATVPVTWAGVDVMSYVPQTSSEIYVYVGTQNTTMQIVVAPDNNYGNWYSGTNPPPLSINNAGGTTTISQSIWLLRQETSIYWASNNAAGQLMCIGWRSRF